MTSSDWERRQILILGKTYPSYSTKYRKTACTGGIFVDTFEMVRLYPIPFRYLEGDRAFKAWQFITARVRPDMSDPRPESYRIDFDSIELGDVVPPTRDSERREYLRRSPNFFASVEALREQQKACGISLGIVCPTSVTACDCEAKDIEEEDIWLEREREVTRQLELFGQPSKPLDYVPARFIVEWGCGDMRCIKRHSMSLLDWSIHELYRKYRNDPDGFDKVRAAMWQRLDLAKRDVFLFLGNFRTVMVNFGLMGAYSAPRRDQLQLISNFPVAEVEE